MGLIAACPAKPLNLTSCDTSIIVAIHHFLAGRARHIRYRSVPGGSRTAPIKFVISGGIDVHLRYDSSAYIYQGSCW